MGKLLTIIFTLLLLSSCETSLEGKRIIGLKDSPAWWRNAPLADRMHYLNPWKVYQLCSLWDRVYDQKVEAHRKIRITIAEVLIKKGKDPMLCRNPASDQGNIAIDKANSAEKRAREAESKAIDAERRARDAERRARNAEKEADIF